MEKKLLLKSQEGKRIKGVDLGLKGVSGEFVLIIFLVKFIGKI